MCSNSVVMSVCLSHGIIPRYQVTICLSVVEMIDGLSLSLSTHGAQGTESHIHEYVSREYLSLFWKDLISEIVSMSSHQSVSVLLNLPGMEWRLFCCGY